MWVIDVIEGADLGARFVLPAGLSVLGRGAGGLCDPRISRAHLEVRAGRSGVYWRKIASAPGEERGTDRSKGGTHAGRRVLTVDADASERTGGGAKQWHRWSPHSPVRMGGTTLLLRRLEQGSFNQGDLISSPLRANIAALNTSPVVSPSPQLDAPVPTAAGSDVNDFPGTDGWALTEESSHGRANVGGAGNHNLPGRRLGGGAGGHFMRKNSLSLSQSPGRRGGISTWIARLAMPMVFMAAWPLLRTGGWRPILLAVVIAVIALVVLRWVGAPLLHHVTDRVREYRTRKLVRCDPAMLLYSVLPDLASQMSQLPPDGGERNAPNRTRVLTLNLDAGRFTGTWRWPVARLPGAWPWARRSTWARVKEETVLGTVGDEGIALALWMSIQALCRGWRVQWIPGPATSVVHGVVRARGVPPLPPDVASGGTNGAVASSRQPRLYLAWAPSEAQLPPCHLVAATGPLPGASWRASAIRFWQERAATPFAPSRLTEGEVPHESAPRGTEVSFPLQRGFGSREFAAGTAGTADGDSCPGAPPDPFLLCPLGRAELTFARAHPCLRAPIGVSTDGIYSLDLQHDGPHALVAGRTGSGKSELLTFFLTALALQNEPAALNLLLFDYKGGATFNPLRALPHTVAVVTDLDAATGARALGALQVELARREQLLTDRGMREVWQLPPEQRPAALVVAVDEFRVLRDSHPELLATLLRLAAQGRSLGMHLLLATQRPAGAISPEIAANTSIRVCLRVSGEVDSRDVLGHAGACLLPSPGGAIVQTDREVEIRTPALGNCPQSWRELSTQVCAQLGGSLARPLWAPPLPACLPTEQIAAPASPYPALVLDDVAAQSWTPLGAPRRSILVAGGAGSGKSTACAQLAASAWADGEHICVVAHPGNPVWAPWWGCEDVAAVDSRDSRHLARLESWWEQLGPGASSRALLVIDDADQLQSPGASTVESLVRTFHALGGRCVLSCSQSRGLARLAPGRLILAGAPPELIPRLGGGASPHNGVVGPAPVPTAVLPHGLPGAGLWLEDRWLTCQVTLPSKSVAKELRQFKMSGGEHALSVDRDWGRLNPALPLAPPLAQLPLPQAAHHQITQEKSDLLGVGVGPAGAVWVPSTVAVIGQPGPLRDSVEAGLRLQLSTSAFASSTSPIPGADSGTPAQCPVVAASPEEALGAIRGPLATAKARGALILVGPLTRAVRALSPVDLGDCSVHPDAVIVVYRSVQEVRLCQELCSGGVQH